ncbi:MAG TPA: hypothetical protein VGN64_06445 [Dyadobacter sp.]|nr:hypothetical protein [Dyadobacter sp.]
MLDKYIHFFQYDILANITVIVTLLPLILIMYRKAYVDPSFRLLFIFLILRFIIDLLMFHFATYRMNNLMLYNLSIVVRYTFLSGMFFYKFENPTLKKFIVPVIVAFICFSVWDIWQCNPSFSNLKEHRIVKYASTIEALLMIFWTLAYFYELIRALKIPSLLTFPFFWICSGLLVFYSSLIFVSPALHYAIRWETMFTIGFLDRILYIFDIVIMLLFSLGIWVFSARYYARH